MRRVLLLILACLTITACGATSSHHHHSTTTARAIPGRTTRAAVTATTRGQSALGSVAPKGWGAPLLGSQPAPVTNPGATHTMYDTVDVSQIPTGAFAVAGYTAGLYHTWPVLLTQFPHAHHLSVAISAIYHADCLDVEPLDATPAQAGPWAKADIAAGFPVPCLYGDLTEMPAIQASLARSFGAGWHQHVVLWLADYTGHPGIVAGYDAVQYTDRALGRNLDASTVTDRFLGIHPLTKCYTRRESAAACTAAKAKVARDAQAVTASQRVYNTRGCPVLEQRITWFSGHLHRYPHYRTAHRREALAASRRVYQARDCGVFAQRVRWFTRAEATVKAGN